MSISSFVSDRYKNKDGTYNWGNVGGDLTKGIAIYGAINPNESKTIDNFLGTGPSATPSGYMGGIPEYQATRTGIAAPDYVREPYTGQPRTGRRYFTDVNYNKIEEGQTAPTLTPKTLAEIEAENAAAQARQGSFNTAFVPPAPPVDPVDIGIGALGPTDDQISKVIKQIKEQYGATPAGYERMIKAMTNNGVSPERLAGIIGAPTTTVQGIINDYYNKTGDWAPKNARPLEDPIIGDELPTRPDFSGVPPVSMQAITDAEIKTAIKQIKEQYGATPAGYERLVKAMGNYDVSPERLAEVSSIPLADVQRVYDKYSTNLAQGGLASLGGQGYYLGGATDGMADKVPATIDGAEPARLSDGEFVIPADVVGHLGNGNSDAGAKNLYAMMDRIREDRTGTTRQGTQINPNKYLMG